MKSASRPGNHDAYLRDSWPSAISAWGEYMSGEALDTKPVPVRAPHRRYCGRRPAPVPCPTAPTLASDASSSRRPQLYRPHPEDARRRRLLPCGDDPPPATTWRPDTRARGLYGAKLFRKAIAENGAELILRGHTHKSSIFAIPGSHRATYPVIGVAAAGAAQSEDGGEDPGPLQPVQDRAPRHGLELHHARIWLSAPQHRYCAEAKPGESY